MFVTFTIILFYVVLLCFLVRCIRQLQKIFNIHDLMTQNLITGL